MRPVPRVMRLWWGSAAATFGRHRSRKNPWSGGSWKGLSIWARGFSALRSWRPGRSRRATASASRLPWFCASADAASSAAANRFSSCRCRSRQAHSRRLTRLPVSLVLRRGGGGAPASLPHHGGRQTHSRSIGSWCRAILHPWLRNRGSVRLWGSRVVTITRQALHQPDLQWDYIIVVRSSAFSSIIRKPWNVSRWFGEAKRFISLSLKFIRIRFKRSLIPPPPLKDPILPVLQ